MFRILHRIGPVAYELDLPPAMRIHPVFHVFCLKPYYGHLRDQVRPWVETSLPLPIVPIQILDHNMSLDEFVKNHAGSGLVNKALLEGWDNDGLQGIQNKFKRATRRPTRCD
ncbi:hypothetical protein Salat_2156400 [Sesamum alatum]|uniref:Tf2-1-like SH3-like domain-containing protein n=1 Tax=Sesamum alatum TaxID=300844 RepID=A0AAE1Y2I5_9LAMI|nr:hypothetical protein Salat_2156400 [Sesamum alatum]